MAPSSGGPLRLLLDTNVVVSGLLWQGPSMRLLDLAVEGDAVELFTSPTLIEELRHTLGYARLAKQIALHATSVDFLVVRYSALVSLVEPVSIERIVAGDSDDDHVLAAAVAARASLIVTGDRKHLLPIGTYNDIAIVTVREAIEKIDAHGTA